MTAVDTTRWTRTIEVDEFGERDVEYLTPDGWSTSPGAPTPG
jgi:hypothetical protein